MKLCIIEGCDRKHYGKGYCLAHFKRWKKTGLVGTIKIRQRASVLAISCEIIDCKNKVVSSGLCGSHYHRKLRHGDPLLGGKIKKKSKNGIPSMWTEGSGYILMQFPNGKRKFQHRYIMEQYLGRELLSTENVHHINGVRSDNRIENLELWSVSQPAGQRVEDKLNWAKEIIKLYDKPIDYLYGTPS